MSLCYNDFRRWCVQTLPAVYDESVSYYEVVCKLINYMKQYASDLEHLSTTVGLNTEEIKTVKESIAQMEIQIKTVEDKMKEYESGEYTDVYVKAVYDWIQANMQTIVDDISEVVRFVTFGLTANGYFEICIPTNWDFIEFDTIMTCGCPCWGHLVLKY